MSVLEAKNVSYRAGGRQILSDVSFAVRPGFTSLIGPNGAGKTTLLRTLSGYLRPQEGQVLLDGKPLQSESAKERARSISAVSQHASFDYAFTALEVVLMGRTAWKPLLQSDTKEDILLAEAALKDAGALEFRDRFVTELSGGERQRVMIARAFCQNGSVLLLDEPVSALDLRHQVSILEAVQRYTKEKGISCVCVLHDLNLAAHFSDRIVLMSGGQIAFRGRPREVLRQDILERIYKTSVRIFEDEEELLVFPDMRTRRGCGKEKT